MRFPSCREGGSSRFDMDKASPRLREDVPPSLDTLTELAAELEVDSSPSTSEANATRAASSCSFPTQKSHRTQPKTVQMLAQPTTETGLTRS